MYRKWIHTIILVLLAGSIHANDTISIPLTIAVFQFMPQDGPTGSTPDPTDPNQFRASLTGNKLLIETQKNAVSYVVIQETRSNYKNEDYFFGISYGEISCPITRPGNYTIRIGYWTSDFIGYLQVMKIVLSDLNGHILSLNGQETDITALPSGFYFLRVETSLGTTGYKFYKQP